MHFISELLILQAAPPMKPSIDVLELLLKGGVVMIPLAILSVLALVLIIERSLFYGRQLKYSDATYREFLQHMSARNNAGATAVCNGTAGDAFFPMPQLTSEASPKWTRPWKKPPKWKWHDSRKTSITCPSSQV
jgi:hypothetical protein